MTDPKSLFLYEEIMLLALRNEKGTVATGYVEYAVAGAVLAESLLDGRISVDDTRKHMVTVHNAEPTGDPIIDECLQRVATASRLASLKTWVGRLAKIKKLRHKVARQLCDRGILRADEDKVLLVFSRKVYPEINPVPEKRILDRLQKAIFTESGQLDPRTVVLISLANGSRLIAENFGRKEIRSRKERIEQIVNGELTGKATKEVIAACEAAVMVSIMMPAIIASTTH
jgi:Golgi phosphoprotein 3